MHLPRFFLFSILLLSISDLALAAEEGDAQAAKTMVQGFYDSYFKKIDTIDSDQARLKWFLAQAAPAADLKSAFKKAYAKADPESGYGSDPIICAQDYPETGLKVSTASIADGAGSVTLVSREKDFDMKLTVQVGIIEGEWHITGIGDLGKQE